jgi:hypothetical protein
MANSNVTQMLIKMNFMKCRNSQTMVLLSKQLKDSVLETKARSMNLQDYNNPKHSSQVIPTTMKTIQSVVPQESELHWPL